MNEDIELIIETSQESMDASIDHLKHELTKIRTGKASPSLLQDIRVDYYGAPTPLQQVANVKVEDARTLSIEPWEKKVLGGIEKAIFAANLGLTPQNDGKIIRINLPPLTEDRRKQLAKQAGAAGEKAKISIRSARREAIEAIKKEVKDGYSEDEGKRSETQIDDMMKQYYSKIEALASSKEKEIMTV
ncbi:MAG: ribosome recycling factor [Saprospiraceae bacterium]